MARKNPIISAPLDIDYQDIYDALAQAGLPSTVTNVKEMCDYLRTIARDAANDALADWRRQHKKQSVSADREG